MKAGMLAVLVALVGLGRRFLGGRAVMILVLAFDVDVGRSHHASGRARKLEQGLRRKQAFLGIFDRSLLPRRLGAGFKADDIGARGLELEAQLSVLDRQLQGAAPMLMRAQLALLGAGCKGCHDERKANGKAEDKDLAHRFGFPSRCHRTGGCLASRLRGTTHVAIQRSATHGLPEVTPPRCERDVITYHLHFGQWARGIVTEAGWAQGPGPVWQAMGVATGPANDGKPAWAGPRGRLQNVGTRRRCRLRVRRSPSATAPDGHGYRRTAPG